MPNELVNGKAAVEQKSVQWMAGVEQIHGCEVSAPLIAGDFFTVQMKIDVTFKGSPRQMLDELCVYQVADGVIVAEQFFLFDVGSASSFFVQAFRGFQWGTVARHPIRKAP